MDTPSPSSPSSSASKSSSRKAPSASAASLSGFTTVLVSARLRPSSVNIGEKSKLLSTPPVRALPAPPSSPAPAFNPPAAAIMPAAWSFPFPAAATRAKWPLLSTTASSSPSAPWRSLLAGVASVAKVLFRFLGSTFSLSPVVPLEPAVGESRRFFLDVFLWLEVMRSQAAGLGAAAMEDPFTALCDPAPAPAGPPRGLPPAAGESALLSPPPLLLFTLERGTRRLRCSFPGLKRTIFESSP
mmetsp:Transcript_29128/g.61564  ORF Transcript_29128/g.61564 Transcript_29128/m.61564 type:complete len:242 (-) Transcript_29128:309-1034(-)